MARSAALAPIFLLLALTYVLAAQAPAGWDSVKHLVAGSEIRVALTDGRKFQGAFQSATDDALMVATSKSQETLSRTMVSKVSSKGKNHRLRNALIGFGAGAGAGLIAGSVADHCSTGHNCFFPNTGKEVFTPLGALIGAIVGVVVPTGGWRDVYRVK